MLYFYNFFFQFYWDEIDIQHSISLRGTSFYDLRMLLVFGRASFA